MRIKPINTNNYIVLQCTERRYIMSKYLLGATKDKEFVFGEFEVTTRNGYSEFTASFETVRPFTANEVDVKDYYENLIDEMDDKWLVQTLKQYDCSFSELAENLANDNGEIQDVRDCSLYSEIIEVNNIDWYFESGTCGQHDTREEMDIIINKEIYNKIHELWDNYHMKKIDDSIIEEVDKLQIELQNLNEKAWIINYIENNF